MPKQIENRNQQKAIQFAAGAMQVLAGPGSGKTYTIVRRIQSLINRLGVEPSNILVITFTRAAAGEMQKRFYELMASGHLPVTFGTFHAVFYHILKQSDSYRSFTLITESEKRKLLLQILQTAHFPSLMCREKTDILLGAISRRKNCQDSCEDFYQDILPHKKFDWICRTYNEFLSEFQKLDFDDMAILCQKLFQESPEVLKKWQKQYRYVLIDEFQDINPIQYQIIRKLAEPENNLFIVGDDDQSIYGFRGARPDIMRQFLEDYPGAEQVLLDINYRCHEQIVKGSLRVIDVNKNRFSKKINAAHSDGCGLILQAFPTREEQYEELIGELKKLQSSVGDKNLRHTAVIYRTNYECALLAEKLLVCRIPFQMREPLQSRYDHFVIKDLLAYMEFAYGHNSRELFHLFMNRPLRYLRKDCARKDPVWKEEPLAYYKEDEEMQKTIRKLFHQLAQIGNMRLYAAVRYIRQVVGYDGYIKDTYFGDERTRFMEIADDFMQTVKRFSDFQDLNNYISQCRELAKQKQAKNQQEESEDAKIGIRLMTMHASKGLEFDRVYLPDLNEGRLPTRQAVSEAAVEEERRMFYVAMTRARKELHCLYCKKETGKDVPSRFLEPILQKRI